MPSAFDPAGLRLPIKLDATSNGEFEPVPLNLIHHSANSLAQSRATEHARRLGLTRREFLTSACGAASTLLAFNAVYAAAGNTGGSYALAPETAFDRDAAAAALGKREFILDVQGHFVDPQGRWVTERPERGRGFLGMPGATRDGKAALANLGAERFVKDVFMDSDTDMMVLSFVPSARDAEPLTIEEAAATRRLVERLDGDHRLLLHGRVNPNQPGDLEGMDELASKWKIDAWKTYTQFGPEGRGFFLSDDVGLAFIEKARQLGVKLIAIHKGIPFGPRSYEHSLCDDIGVVAKRYPDVDFLVYHSGYVIGQAEGPYRPDHNEGVDSLVRSLELNGIKPNSNVYAELGSTWRFLMRDPTSAAHALGKLLKACGPDNVLWGTDSIWYGSPQDQIQAFRAFQIAPELRERHGYPELTPALKARIFGLNACKPYKVTQAEVERRAGRDRIGIEKLAYLERGADPHYATYGPRTRREFLNLLGWNA
jgi:predicted TIM-barrel fold metal-dependent hydrolase